METSSLRRCLLVAAASVALVAVGAAPARSTDFDLPIGGAAATADEEYAEPPAEDEPPTFYDEDIPDESQSVIYVIDRSSSMSLPTQPFVDGDGQVISDGTRLDYVKAELRRSISSLPSDFTFNMIIYDECVESWKPGRVRADAAHKAEALAWIDTIEPWGWTNTGGATSRALDDHGNQVVLLLSDGAPNFLDCSQTYVADFETHRRIIRSANMQHAVIHTFGLGLDQETREFMAMVARDSGGSFREID